MFPLVQDETIQNLREEKNGNVYRHEAQATVFQTENAVIEKIDIIKQFQGEARFALSENETILEKYAARANAKMQTQKTEVPSPNNQKEIVSIALGGKSSNTASNKINDHFFQAVQKEITISDFNKFAANDRFLGEIKINIRKEFAEISQGLNVLEESKFKVAKSFEPAEKEKTILGDSAVQELIENKPLSLRVFEKELERVEKQLIEACV